MPIDPQTASIEDVFAEAVEVLGLDVTDLDEQEVRDMVSETMGSEPQTEDQLLRAEAKAMGVKSWHNLGLDKLKKAMDEKKSGGSKKKKVKVIFHNQDGSDGTASIKITVNGYRYRIHREKEVELPIEAMDVIDNAVITEFYRDEIDGSVKERSRRRFSYTKTG